MIICSNSTLVSMKICAFDIAKSNRLRHYRPQRCRQDNIRTAVFAEECDLGGICER